MKITFYYRLAFCLLALGVVLGAFGAHTLKTRLAPESLQAWQTGVQYHFIHSLGLLLVLPLVKYDKAFQWCVRLIIVGLICFSGSLYFLACKDMIGLNISWLGPITPFGGVAWIAAWLSATVGTKSIVTQ